MRSMAPLHGARTRLGGERLVQAGPHAFERTASTLLQDLGLPPWQRARLPLLFDQADGQLLAAADLAASGRLRGRGCRRARRTRLLLATGRSPHCVAAFGLTTTDRGGRLSRHVDSA
jgi:tRNA(Ile)-lysidine synthetase-like protein